MTFDFPDAGAYAGRQPAGAQRDASKVAFVRGPITFCAEGKDNGANLHLLHADGGHCWPPEARPKVEEFDFHAGAKGIDDKGARARWKT